MAKQVSAMVDGVNEYKPESWYLQISNIPEKWPISRLAILSPIIIIPTKDFDLLEDFIMNSREMGLTHLVVDGAENRPNFLNDVFYNDRKYPYLIKIYRINFETFEKNIGNFKS